MIGGSFINIINYDKNQRFDIYYIILCIKPLFLSYYLVTVTSKVAFCIFLAL